jgi:hypothetical protein
LGAPAAVVLEARKNSGADFYVLEENWSAVEMFLRLQTQWVTGGMGSLIGLNYQSVEFLFKIYKIKKRKQMIEDLHDIERGVLEAIKEQNEGAKSGA